MSQTRATQEQVKVGGDRILTYEVSGPSDGLPVFLLHGTPGSSRGPKPRGIVLHRLGIRLIAYDRPGYGGSTTHEGRRVVDAAEDVGELAEQLGVERYGVIGRSGGGPHALAVAARRPDEVIAAAVLVSLAPATAPDLDWYGGMTGSNVNEYTTADACTTTLTERIRLRAERIKSNPDSLLKMLRAEMKDSDRRFVDDVSMRRLLAQTYAEALRTGPHGWIDDALALRANWGFELDEITVPVRLWHGADDNFSPVSHTQWLAERIRPAKVEVHVQGGVAHFGAVEILPQMLGWFKERESKTPKISGSERMRVDDAV